MPDRSFESIVTNSTVAAAAVADTVWRGELNLRELVALHPAVKQRLDQIAEDYATHGCESLQGQMLGLEQAYTKFMLNAAEEKDPRKSDRWLQLALRCQEQFRKSLATVHDIRNPSRVAFIKSYVQNQLNQVAIDNPKNQLGEFNREPMDGGTAATPAGNNLEAQALVEIDRTENRARQGNLFQEC